MSRLQLEDFYYMAEDIIDDMDEDDYGRAGGDMDAHEYDMLTKVTDTSSGQARKGKDIQGIPWERLNITREDYRLTRLEQYKNYENIPASGDAVDKEYKQMEKGGNYYEFFHNTRLVKPTILHFQLRNLVWATSKHDVYLMSNYSVMHWSSLSCHLSEILNFSGHVAPTEKHPGSLLEGFTQTQISTLAVKDNFMVAGGFQGELTFKIWVWRYDPPKDPQHLDRKGVAFCTRTTYDDNAITNAIEIYDSLRGGINFMAANNDCSMREYDTERFQLLNHLRFPWPVNHTSVSPDRRLITVVGDSLDGLLVDLQNGKTVATVVGHLDYSFASAWHPDGRIFATGNQDKTCRVWDVRNLSRAVATLKGNLGAIRSIRFSSDGQFMVAAEPADFVHVYSTRADYEKRQEIDFFGEISGVSLSPDDESLYIGIWDRTYASLLQYNKRHTYAYLDSYL
ncbi:putative WD repeat-containing protein C2A9.03-like [Gossypium australe]|uniref:Putative WD repeat-containing protein C2A9.03-like n=1 Tax=Gossypium australe TaxID=47621 RepID=A0A5B6WF51_9ROSI|nr:putative WD repeat-containing protein C2A9.03-like [Gossypium australe]